MLPHPIPTVNRREYAGAAPPPTRKRCLQVALVLLLPGCVSAGIDRADRAAQARVDQAAREARQIAQETRTALDASVAAAVADLTARASAVRAETLADVDARLTAQREAAAADVARLLAHVLAESAALREESAAWRQTATDGLAESARWREEVAAWRAEATALRQTVAAVTQPTPPGPGPAPLDPTDRYALWAALAGAAFTVGKTGLRLWKSRQAAA